MATLSYHVTDAEIVDAMIVNFHNYIERVLTPSELEAMLQTGDWAKKQQVSAWWVCPRRFNYLPDDPFFVNLFAVYAADETNIEPGDVSAFYEWVFRKPMKPQRKRHGMKHRINGCPVNLGSLTPEQLQTLITGCFTRIATVQDQLETLQGEWYRRDALNRAANPHLWPVSDELVREDLAY